MFNTTFYQNNDYLTPTQHRALITITCRNVSTHVQRDKLYLESSKHQYAKKILYSAPTNPSFYNIYQGEICFEPQDHNYRSKSFQPYARSCLNGLCLPTNKPNPFFRILGLSVKTDLWNTNSALLSTDHVVAMSGLISTTNTSVHNIRSGEYIVASLPDDSRENQQSRVVDPNIPAKRAIYDSKPLRSTDDVISFQDAQHIINSDMFHDFVAPFILKNYLSKIYALSAYCQINNIDVDIPIVVNTTLNDYKTLLHAPSTTHDNEHFYDPISPHNQPVPPSPLTDIFISTSIAPIITSHIASKIIGVAEKSATPQTLFDILLKPLPMSLLEEFLFYDKLKRTNYMPHTYMVTFKSDVHDKSSSGSPKSKKIRSSSTPPATTTAPPAPAITTAPPAPATTTPTPTPAPPVPPRPPRATPTTAPTAPTAPPASGL